MASTLPIAILDPHGGLTIPSEVADRIALGNVQIFNEADAYADRLYNFRDQVLHWVSFPNARAIIDVNRPRENTAAVPPSDGVVKLQTSYGDPVYQPGQAPDEALERHLIETYWQPWHDQLAAIGRDERVKLVIEGHTMAAAAPSSYGDSALLRPRATVCNLGDLLGNLSAEVGHLSAPAALAQTLSSRLSQSLTSLPELAPTGPAAALNTPYRGGWNLWAHGGKQQPWLMIELNRGLYIGPQTGNSPIVPPKKDRINLLREIVWNAIEATLATLTA